MNLQQLIDKREWSQKDLADRLGVSQSVVSRWLSGEREITIDTAATIAERLGMKWVWTRTDGFSFLESEKEKEEKA